MKKFFRFLSLSMMVAMIALTSCGNNLKEVNEKIDKDGIMATFTDKEYAAMADYVEKNLDRIKAEDFFSSDMSENDKHLVQYIMFLGAAEQQGLLDNATDQKVKEIITEIDKLVFQEVGTDLGEEVMDFADVEEEEE